MEKFRPAIRFGVIWGVLAIVIFLVQWALIPDTFVTIGGGISQIVIYFLALPIVFMILGARDCKPNFEPYSYWKAFSAAFLTGIVSAVVLFAFQLLFMYVIDPGFDQHLQEQVLDTMSERLGDMDPDQADKIMNDTIARMEASQGLVGKLKQSMYGIIWYFILGLIIGAVQKSPKEGELT